VLQRHFSYLTPAPEHTEAAQGIPGIPHLRGCCRRSRRVIARRECWCGAWRVAKELARDVFCRPEPGINPSALQRVQHGRPRAPEHMRSEVSRFVISTSPRIGRLGLALTKVNDAPMITKLRAPRARAHLVARPRLTENLGRDPQRRLTLLSAPAGFGKTTLLAEWLQSRAGDGPSVAWLSLDEGDDDPARFLSYLEAPPIGE
jgi:hypothetical protein